MRTSVDIVVPCFNEEKNLPPLFLNFLDFKERHKDEFELNLIIVDNGSTDDTSRVAKAFIAYEKSCRLIVLSRNFGKEASLSAGLLESTSDLVVPIDADLQDPIEVISDMLKCWSTHKPDVVLAKRISRDGDSLSRRLFSRMYLSLFSKLSDIEIPPDVGEFRLMSRKVVESFSQLHESERFVRGLFAWMGYKTEVIEFQRTSRSQGKSRFSFSKLLNLGVDGIVSFSIKPLRIAISMGIATSGIAFIYSIVILVERINNKVSIPGYASLAFLILILNGIQLLSIGVLGEYIGKTLMESKKRPIYLISEKHSNTEK
jgi:glycosyltransferase involved in cell wall biosynthesis